MDNQRHGCLVVIGSGPGIGSHVAGLFAARGFSKIALLARRTDQLQKDKQFVLSEVNQGGIANVTVNTYDVDVTDLEGLSRALGQVQADLGPAECVFYNAARVQPSTLLEFDEDEMIYDFKIACTALHIVAKWAIPQLTNLHKSQGNSKPTFLVTSSLLPQDPDTGCVVLSVVKAAQFNLTQSIAKVYGPLGVHAGVVVVGGPVDPSNKNLNPKNIAKHAWQLFDQPKDLQTFATEILE